MQHRGVRREGGLDPGVRAALRGARRTRFRGALRVQGQDEDGAPVPQVQHQHPGRVEVLSAHLHPRHGIKFVNCVYHFIFYCFMKNVMCIDFSILRV